MNPYAFSEVLLKEKEFLLAVLNYPEQPEKMGEILSTLVRQNLDWDYIQKPFICQPLIYYYLKADWQQLGIPEEVMTNAQQCYTGNTYHNIQRLMIIQEVAQVFADNNLPALFLKGAAELVRLHQDSTFLGLRPMSDIDLMVSHTNLYRACELLESKGHVLDTIGYDNRSREQVLFTFFETGEYNFNLGQLNHLDLHHELMRKGNEKYYPTNFTTLLFNEKQPVIMQNIPINVPSIEQLITYAVCDYCSAKEFHLVLDRFIPEDIPQPVSKEILLEHRIDMLFLRNAYRLKLLKNQCSDINWGLVENYLTQVPQKYPLLNYFLYRADMLVPNFLPLQLKRIVGEDKQTSAKQIIKTDIFKKAAAKIRKRDRKDRLKEFFKKVHLWYFVVHIRDFVRDCYCWCNIQQVKQLKPKEAEKND